MPTPHSTMPTPISTGSPVRKIKQEKNALHRVDSISARRPILSKSQPKNSAAKASTAMAAAYSRLRVEVGKASVRAACSVMRVKSAKPKANRQMAAMYSTKDFCVWNSVGASAAFSNISGCGYLTLASTTSAMVISAGMPRTAKLSR